MTAPLSKQDEDLESLFDRVAAERAGEQSTPPNIAEVAPAAQAATKIQTSTDAVEDLEALFDSVSAQSANNPVSESAKASVETAPVQTDGNTGTDVFDRVGKLTRNLHDALLQLGYDKTMQKAVTSLPDTRDRLAYIATLTGQAADRTLSAIDKAKPIQEEMQKDAQALSGKWDLLLAGNLSIDEFKTLVANTNQFLKQIPQKTDNTNTELLEIMMAQDFHDLTGQVIKKIVDLAQSLEKELLCLLLEISPQGAIVQAQFEGDLNGPVINSDRRNDVVTNQAQVDDLLESLGF